MPMDGDNSKGFMFITLANAADALAFTKAMHQHSFDKKHTFRVVPFSEVERYESLSEEWTEPAITSWQPRVSFIRPRSPFIWRRELTVVFFFVLPLSFTRE